MIAEANLSVRIHCTVSSRHNPAAYFAAVEKRLAAAGIEFSDGEPVGGTLKRIDDPSDFGMSTWIFTPNV